MNIDTKIEKILIAILNGNFDSQTILLNESREEVIRVLSISEREGFLAHSSSQQPLITHYIGGGFMLHPTAYVTRSGEQFLEGYDRNKSQSQTTFHIDSVSNSALGNYNTVNNYSAQPIKDLVEFVKTLSKDNDKELGEELINTLKNEKVQPGYLAKFDGFLNKYPKTIDLISSFLTSLVITKLT